MGKSALQFHSHSLSLVDMSVFQRAKAHTCKDFARDILEIP